MATKDNLIALFDRDMLKLRSEISAYAREETIWEIAGLISNSGGNLCLHLMGNLQHYIGHVLGGSDYLRNRAAEFTRKDVPVTELLTELDHTREVVTSTLRSLPVEELEKVYPERVFDYEMTTGYFLLHLLAHLNYHLGQVNYHRRLLDTPVH
jgi:uncharacterized damage-inducible protein DinB